MTLTLTPSQQLLLRCLLNADLDTLACNVLVERGDEDASDGEYLALKQELLKDLELLHAQLA